MTVLQKKLVPSRPGAIPGSASVEALLRKIMPREADKLLSMDVFVTALKTGRPDKQAVLDQIDAQDLVYLLEDGAEGRGLCKVTAGLLSALTEVQMSGRVTEADPPVRTPTRADGIVASAIIDQWMQSAIQHAKEDGLEAGLPFLKFSRKDRVLNKRNADLSIDPVDYQSLEIEMSLGGGMKTGGLAFYVPLPAPKSERISTLNEAMQENIPELSITLTAVLDRVPVAMSRAKSLSVGDVIDINLSALNEVKLLDINGAFVCRGRLGQLNGQKAVRLQNGTDPIAPDGQGVLPSVSAPLGIDAAPPSLPMEDIPSLPDLPGTNALEDDADHGALPDLPDLPGEGISSPSELPELPELPDLPDLPDLPPIE